MEKPQDAKAVVDGNVITSQGPGTSLHGTLKKGGKKVVFLSEIIAERKRERERADVAIQCNTVLPNDCPISLTFSKKYPKKRIEVHRVPSQLARHQSGTEVAVCLEDRGRTLR